jgi:acetyltransferase-like isoleucine patch superfamily enzyme
MPWLEREELERRFLAVGTGVLVSSLAQFYDTEKMVLGDNSRIDDFCLVSGRVELGRNVHLAAYTHVAGGDPGVFFGDFSGCAYGCHVLAQSDDYSGRSMTNPTVPSRFKQETFEAVRVGRHAILGAGTIVLPGCDVGEGAATGAGTVVRRPLEPWTIYAGERCRPIRSRSRDLLDLEQEYLRSEDGG